MPCHTITEETIIYEDGQYNLGLSWRDRDWNLPNNVTFAHARLEQLKRYIKTYIYCDGSEIRYGECPYSRLADIDDNVTCSLIMRNSRIAPLKQMFVPRLELSTAMIAYRFYQLITDELDIRTDSVIIWTDSTILLRYVQNI